MTSRPQIGKLHRTAYSMLKAAEQGDWIDFRGRPEGYPWQIVLKHAHSFECMVHDDQIGFPSGGCISAKPAGHSEP
jgi:hypothetical protein